MKQIIIISILLLTFGCCDIVCERQKNAYSLIKEIEIYRRDNQQLPANVSELGYVESEDALAFYERTSDSTYTVWYGLNLGESNIYNSNTGWIETD